MGKADADQKTFCYMTRDTKNDSEKRVGFIKIPFRSIRSVEFVGTETSGE